MAVKVAGVEILLMVHPLYQFMMMHLHQFYLEVAEELILRDQIILVEMVVV
jgi:hypothetical protein